MNQMGHAADDTEVALAQQQFESSLHLQQNGEFDQAIQKLKEIKSDKSDTQTAIANNLGCLYFEKGEFEQAESYFKQAISLHDENWEAHRNIADLYFFTRQYEYAFLYYEKVFRTEPTIEIVERIGDCMIALGKIETASMIYQQALQMNPHSLSVVRKLEWIVGAELGVPLRMDVPSVTKNTLSLFCYIPGSQLPKAVTLETLLSRLTHLANEGIQVTLVSSDPQVKAITNLHSITLAEWTNINKHHLADVFVSVGDLAVFDQYRVNSKLKILLTDAAFPETQLDLMNQQAREMNIDYIWLSTNLSRQKLLDSESISDADVLYVDLTAEAPESENERIDTTIRKMVVDMTLCYAQQYMVTNNPLKAIMLLTDSIVKLDNNEQLSRLRHEIEELYPQLEDPAAYQTVQENREYVPASDVEAEPCFLWLIEQLKHAPKLLNILDAGCGDGARTIQLNKLGYQVTGVDISQKRIDAARKKTEANASAVAFVQADIQKLPAEIQAVPYDAVVCFGLLEQVLDVPGAIQKIETITKADGLVFLTVSAEPIESLQAAILGNPNSRAYIRSYSMDELEKLFQYKKQVRIQEIKSEAGRWYGVTYMVNKQQIEKSNGTEQTPVKATQTAEPKLKEMFELAMNLVEAQELEQAFAVFTDMLKIDPEQPQVLFNAAVLVDKLGQREEAIQLLKSVIEIDASMPDPHFYLASIYSGQGRYMLALDAAKAAIERDIGNAAYYQLYKSIADHVGVAVEDATTDIVFYTAGATFNGNTPYQQGLGGSENALVYMAKALARLGYNVRVFNECDQPGYYDAVKYGDITDFHIHRHFNKIKVLISLRSLKPFKLNTQADVRILWIQDNTNVIFLENEQVADLSLDKIFAVSKWQRDDWTQHFNLDERQFFITRNGVDRSFIYSPQQNAGSKRMIYLSRPERGLRTLLTLFPKIRKQIPDAELVVCSYRFNEQNEEIDEYRQMANQAGVSLKGALSKQALMDELAAAALMIYPTAQLETSCTAAIEAQALGVPVVTTACGALPETVAHNESGIIIPGNPDSAEYQQQFVATVVDLLNNQDTWKKLSQSGRERMAEKYEWDTIAREWQQQIEQLKRS